MNRFHLATASGIVLALAPLLATAQQYPRIGYVFPAGGRQGTTFLVTVGGQFLGSWKGDYQIDVLAAHFSGGGIQATVRKDIRHLNSQETQTLQDKLDQLRRKDSKDAETLRERFELQVKYNRARSEFMRREAQPALADSVTLEITLAADADPGRRELRVETPRGISNPLAFYVGRLPEFREQESEPTFDPQDFLEGRIRLPPGIETPITLPAVVNGQIIPREPYMVHYSDERFTPGTADRFGFQARRGQQLVIAAAARELIPYLPDAVPGWFQATLALYDARGRQVAYSDDYRFHPDPVLLLKVPEDGQYVVEIKDAIYRGRPDFVYRITLGELPYITGVFPLGGPAGAATPVRLSGWNLPADTVTIDARDMPPGLHPVSVRKGEMTSNTLPFSVDTLPESLEQEPNDSTPAAQAVTLPGIVNGRIDRPDDWDVFRFEGRAGQDIIAEVRARRLESPLDSVLELFDAAGGRLAFNDDHEDKFDDLRTHHADSLIRFTLPADGIYYVRLGDAQSHGGPQYAYRLRLSEPRPDFELRVAPSCLHAITWRLNPFAVYVLRKDGFNGEIALRFKDDPYGLALSGAVVPEGQDQIRLTLAIATLLSADPIRLCLEGRAVIDGKEVVHPAVPAEVMTQAFFYKHVVPANDLTLVPEDRARLREEAARAAKEDKPFPPPAANRSFQQPMEILSEQPARIPVGGTVEVQVRLGWSRDGQIQVELSDPPEGITVDRATWTERGLALVLRSDAKSQPKSKGNLMANAFLQTTVTEKDGKTREARNFIGPLPALPFEIVEPFSDVWPMPQWTRAEPADVEMDEAKLAQARDYALTGGGSGYITRHGRLVMAWGDPRARYDLKSTTKSFGSIALGLAVKDGKLRLEDTARRHHPTLGVPPEENAQAGWLDEIAVLHLASQTAGFEKPGGYTKLLFRPGTQWDYSDSGPNWLAECITLAYRRDLDEWMFERVFTPLGIQRSDLTWRKNSYRPATIDGIARREFGAGIHANVDAMARIGYLMLREGQWNGLEILTRHYARLAPRTPTGHEKLAVRLPETYGNAAPHYGLLWWNNADRTLRDVPADAYWSWGLYDSLIVVIPSLDIVVARAGQSWKREQDADHYGVLKPFFTPIVQSVRCLPSPVIKEIVWAPPETIVRRAQGSDNWPLTWADDDWLYTAYGDGNGFEPRLKEKLSLGLARVRGNPPEVVAENLRTPSLEQQGDGVRGKKASGLLMVDGVLYLWARNAGNSQLAWSADHGATWTWADWKLTTSFGCPTFLNFGRNYEGARDEFVYVYSHDADSAYQRAERMVLARVSKSRLREQAGYEFFQELDSQGRPIWTKEVARRGAVLPSPGRCYRSSVSYNAGLKRYLWLQTGLGEDTRFGGGLAIYDAPEPWGPWTTVFATDAWDVGPGETASFPTKWISPDGCTLYIVFSGDDCFSVRRATLKLR